MVRRGAAMCDQRCNALDLVNLPEPGALWELIEKIGEGTFGEVHVARHVASGESVPASFHNFADLSRNPRRALAIRKNTGQDNRACHMIRIARIRYGFRPFLR